MDNIAATAATVWIWYLLGYLPFAAVHTEIRDGFARVLMSKRGRKNEAVSPELVLVLLRMFTLGTPKSDGTRHITCRMLNSPHVIHIEPHLMKHQKVQQNSA